MKADEARRLADEMLAPFEVPAHRMTGEDVAIAATLGLILGAIWYVITLAGWRIAEMFQLFGPVQPFGWPMWAAIALGVLVFALLLWFDRALDGHE